MNKLMACLWLLTISSLLSIPNLVAISGFLWRQIYQPVFPKKHKMMKVSPKHYAQTATSSLSRTVMYSDAIHWCRYKTVKR